MQYIQLDGTELQVSQIAFGTAGLHHHLTSKNRQQLLHCAFDHGITHFDTAPYYGYGLAELALGEFLRGRRNSVTVTTKVGLYPRMGMTNNSMGLLVRKIAGKAVQPLAKPVVDWRLATAEQSLISSLKRLATDYVDILMLHEPDTRLIDTAEYQRWLEDQKRLGKIRYWGIAGEVAKVTPWAAIAHPLAQVVQTRGNVTNEPMSVESGIRRPPQITYGYFSALWQSSAQLSAVTVMEMALQRNPTGVILFSSSKCTNIEAMAKLLS